MQSRNEYVVSPLMSLFSRSVLLTVLIILKAANRFCVDNFLSKPTLLMIQKIKEHILQSLDKAGVLSVSAGGTAMRGQPSFRRGGPSLIPESLNGKSYLCVSCSEFNEL